MLLHTPSFAIRGIRIARAMLVPIRSFLESFIFSKKGKSGLLAPACFQINEQINGPSQLKRFCVGIYFLAPADWPDASVSRFILLPPDILSTACSCVGRKAFPCDLLVGVGTGPTKGGIPPAPSLPSPSPVSVACPSLPALPGLGTLYA